MQRIDRIMPYVLPLIVALAALWYYRVNPVSTPFSLICPWKLLTGTQCPACGFQRALFALLHGRLLEALHYNYFFIFSVPYACLAVLVTWYNVHHVFDRLRHFLFHRYTLSVYVVLYMGWWVVRNLYHL